MLPILGYHVETDFSTLDGVFDDSLGKECFYYLNLPLKMLSSRDFGSYNESTILLIALDNGQPVLAKLLYG